MASKPASFLDSLLRLRLADLSWDQFERFFLGYLNSGIFLSVSRGGKLVSKRIKHAQMYAPGSGRKQDGIDLRLETEDNEVWAVQCKKVKKWTVAQTKKAIKRAKAFPAKHYFLAVSCDTDRNVHQEVAQHPTWTLWNLDTICSDFRRLVAPANRRDALPFLTREEVKKFLPFVTDALVTPDQFFERYLGADKPLRHDWPIVGREDELKRLAEWANGNQKVALLSARGGEGKTRVVREFCARIQKDHPEVEVLYLNPYREDNDFSLGLNADAASRIFVIDDAHRVDQVPIPLLDQVRQDPKARIVLACRPQGRESIVSRLIEVGIPPTMLEPMSIPGLKKSAAIELAKGILGPALDQHLDEFVKLTEKNPFLITTAGALLREKRLLWGSWKSHEEFRRRVFEEFETENLNLSSVPEAERGHARALLRLLAVLSPVARTSELIERAEKLVKGVQSIEPLLNFLKVAELVVGPDQALRVSPDLFADFLVYEACFEPNKKMPVWIKQVLTEFRDHGAVLIRNISEASWIAELNGVNDETILTLLTDWQQEQFLKQSFLGRQSILTNWTTFSQYLPKQTLDLVRLAIREKVAPKDASAYANTSDLNSYARLLKYIPALLRPVAKYHLKYSHQALDILWMLGCSDPKPQHNNQNHPWTVAAEVFKYEDTKPRAYYDSALDWLEKLLKRPEARGEFLKPNPVLSLFFGPCFSRTYDASYSEGRTVHFVEKHVSPQGSEVLRARARQILEALIDEGTPMLALDALSALEVAIRRAATPSDRGILNPEKYREEWRPDRLKALALFEKALMRYQDVAVRYEIRRTLKRNLIHEEDPVFAKKCRKVLKLLVHDLSLRTANAMMSDYAYEFEDAFKKTGDGAGLSKIQDRWMQIVGDTAKEVARKYPSAAKLYDFISPIVEALTGAGHNLNLYPFLASLGASNPKLAAAIATKVLTLKGHSALLHQWIALIDNGHVSDATKFKLFEQAVAAKVKGAGVAVIRHLSAGVQRETLLDKRSRELLSRIARKAKADEAVYLFQAIAHSSVVNLPWCFQLLETLTKKDLDPALLGVCITALAPFQKRKTNPSSALIRRVFKRMIAVPDLGFFEHGHVWESLKQMYPMEVYELLRDRIAFARKVKDYDYTAVPHDLDGRVVLSEIAKHPGIQSVIKDLWHQVLHAKREHVWQWVKLFQAVVFTEERFWKDRLIIALKAAKSVDEIAHLRSLISFDGSLIVFGYPEITELFLRSAIKLGGEDGLKEIRAELYGATGPKVRGYENGRLEKEYDYVEAAAEKAAKEHELNDLLGPFYRWIVEREQADKLRSRMRSEED